MTSIRLLLVSSSALALASCSWFNKGGQGNYDTTPSSGGYDTSNPYGVPGGATPYQQPASSPSNATYSKAAYEDTSVTSAPATETPPPAHSPSAAAAPKTPAPAPKVAAAKTPAAAPAKVSSSGGAVHVVVKGDTLWGISRKYNVPVDAIKKANGLTKDTVVLGAKLQIPAH
jgi:LysM repeat protein